MKITISHSQEKHSSPPFTPSTPVYIILLLLLRLLLGQAQREEAVLGAIGATVENDLHALLLFPIDHDRSYEIDGHLVYFFRYRHYAVNACCFFGVAQPELRCVFVIQIQRIVFEEQKGVRQKQGQIRILHRLHIRERAIVFVHRIREKRKLLLILKTGQSFRKLNHQFF